MFARERDKTEREKEEKEKEIQGDCQRGTDADKKAYREKLCVRAIVVEVWFSQNPTSNSLDTLGAGCRVLIPLELLVLYNIQMKT